MTEKSRKYVEETLSYMEAHYMEPIRVEDLAKRQGISRAYLSRLMQEYGSLSATEYLRRIRLDHARDELLAGGATVAEIAKHVGYRDPAAFSRYFRDFYGASPSEYRSLNSNS